MSAIEACRTAALGGHRRRCVDCGHTTIAYNSCRDRHCPKCQDQARAAWVAARRAERLPVPYFHVVFTLPTSIGTIAFQNKATVYAILFRVAASELMRRFLLHVLPSGFHRIRHFGFLAKPASRC
jgi:hypothetical protein